MITYTKSNYIKLLFIFKIVICFCFQDDAEHIELDEIAAEEGEVPAEEATDLVPDEEPTDKPEEPVSDDVVDQELAESG